MIQPPNEQFCQAGDVELCYETFGDSSGEPLLLIMGLGTQMLAWNTDFCGELADRGFYVIRFDNRDIGRSQQFDETPPPSPIELVTRRIKNPAYTLEDMADDGVRLLDCLGVESAHVTGASMGGMIAQTMASRHPSRVRSLVSIMSTTGNRWKGQPALKTMPVLLSKPPATKEASIERTLKVFALIGSPGFERDEEELREVSALSYDRRGSAAGPGRQLAAVIVSGDRTPALGKISAPTLVIHGTADKLVRPSGGKATAQAIDGAKLMLVDGMGHDMPRGVWPKIIDGIAETAARASQAVPA
ncbi:MAG: Beta-ketoadipate enol-lactone hydrolase [uncultured Solirubrobacteraceae bacterium]|uniref:Beta-ketoadipate enol-lactone hydrolase n=1 Tax=uncultured Solirubrobacteraceae bacterium TaxID=1162706 RepID=A0A6J4U2N8_9ACTN|nr:MAG: Beta-ketoadipate enol-lactone hydrolase [uncultured Solirubrobacteraceae bacterium]